ncbi:MAG: bacteriohemerythrin [Zoogloeaceae bacterium]|jgi:hemerythrin|nr:bacteriohemerythrin [Zoogloeaceae bacterium]
MPFMPWSEQFVLGIESIDKQHRWLVNATNQLHEQIESAQPDEAVVRKILEGLVEYTVNHFIQEEELFVRFGYPETEPHQAEHDRFTKEAIHLLLNFEKGEAVTERALEFLKTWLTHHILVSDKAYAPFLKEHGIQ